ncbi:hypothetical protein QEN19_002080 [Hanseniaspora menglaensis]
MSQVSNTDHSFDSSFFVNGDISILPEDIDALVEAKDQENQDVQPNTKESYLSPDVSAAHVFARSRGSNRKLKLPKTFTNVNKINKSIYEDHKFLRKPKVNSSEEMKEIIMEKCKIWKVINDPNVNDRIMSLDISYIMKKLIDEYYKNINREKATSLTVVKHRGKNLTQFEYNLIFHNELTLDNLLINNFTTKKNRTVKYTALKENYKRYFDVKNKRIVVHHAKNFKEVIPPMTILETVLQIHLINNHIKLEPLYRQLLKKYVNVTRNVVKDSLQMCSICKSDPSREASDSNEDSDDRENLQKSKNIFTQKVKPWERVQVELYELKDDAIKILTLKEYYSHFEWTQKIDITNTDTTEQIANALYQWIITTATAIPISFFSISLDFDELHKILSKVGTKTNIKLGAIFLSTMSFKKMRSKNEEKYSKMSLIQVYETMYQKNNEYLSSVTGVPRKLLVGSGIDFDAIETLRKAKQDKYSSWENTFIEQ